LTGQIDTPVAQVQVYVPGSIDGGTQYVAVHGEVTVYSTIFNPGCPCLAAATIVQVGGPAAPPEYFTIDPPAPAAAPSSAGTVLSVRGPVLSFGPSAVGTTQETLHRTFVF